MCSGWCLSTHSLFWSLVCITYICSIKYCQIDFFFPKSNHVSLFFFPCAAFCPYHIGHFSVVGLGFEDYVSFLLLRADTKVWYYCKKKKRKGAYMLTCVLWSQVRASHFEGLITTIVGYVLLAVTLIVCHVSFQTTSTFYYLTFFFFFLHYSFHLYDFVIYIKQFILEENNWSWYVVQNLPKWTF